MVPDPTALHRLLVAKVRTSVASLEDLMLSDIWDALPPDRQRAIAEAVESMRADADTLEAVLGL